VRYADNAEIDRDDASVRISLALNNERRVWSIGGDYVRDSTLISEFDNTGLLGFDEQRVERSLNSGWRRVLSERGSISIGASVMDVAYGHVNPSPFVDYTYRAVQAAYTLASGRRSMWQFSVNRGAVDSGAGAGNSTNKQLRIGWSHTFSERLSGQFGVGAFLVDSAGAPSDGARPSVDFGLTRQWHRLALTLAGRRDVRPEGIGGFVREDSVELGVNRVLTERLSINASLHVARVGSASPFAAFLDRDYSQLGATVDWRLARRWRLSASLVDRAQESPLVPRGDGLLTGVTLTYRGL
jgi:hypothetical protein